MEKDNSQQEKFGAKFVKTAEEKLAEEVVADFEARQAERKLCERGWQLNMNFVNGKQYCEIDGSGEIVEETTRYFWQQTRIFNHIAPIVDTRLSKLARIRPALSVRAASEDEKDRHSASLASAILAAVNEYTDFDGVISEATMWSEICGTAFYKVVWNSRGGNVIGAAEDGSDVREGRAEIIPVSPFEIYPYSLTEEDIYSQPSIIHAKALPVEDIYTLYGLKLEGRDLKEFSPAEKNGKYGNMRDLSDYKRGYELVLERYEKPTAELPDGRLTVVVGGALVFDGVLPYINGEDGKRQYPFVKQVSQPAAGAFFGSSVVDRLIPVQRAFNAVKNRKHEFLNRIAMGTVAVEDGSVDTDELAEDGLIPGKIIVYRQGGTPPEMLTMGSVPDEFWKEEESLLSEFRKISGTGDLTENASSFSGITSATGLQLIIDQDDTRLNVSYDGMKRAIKSVGKQVLRLFRQFANDLRLMKYAGENNVLKLFYFKGSDISSDDVVLDADSDLNLSPAQRRTVVYELLDRGLFTDENGKLTTAVKNKVLEILGFNSLAGERDLSELNRARAGEENLLANKSEIAARSYDDHKTHICEHTAYLLTAELSAEAEARLTKHIAEHKKYLKEESKNDKTSD